MNPMNWIANLPRDQTVSNWVRPNMGPSPANRLGQWVWRGVRNYTRRQLLGGPRYNPFIDSRSNVYARKGQLKWYDITGGPTAFTTTNQIQNLFVGIVQGTTASTRIANRIIVKSISGRIILQMDSANANAPGAFQYRVAFVQDKQCNGAIPAATDVFTQDDSTSPQNLVNTPNRFRILKKFEGVIPALPGWGTGTFTLNNYRELKVNIKCDIPIEYSGVTGTITDVRTNNVFMIFAANQVVNGSHMSTFYLRTRYEDPVR